MTKTFLAAIALTVAAAGAASANSQLALSLGVEPGQYSTAELIQLRDAREDKDLTKARFIEKRAAAVARGVPFAGPSTDTIIASYVSGLSHEDGRDANLDHFIAKVTGGVSVSAETTAFAQAHLASDIEDEN